MPDEVGFAPDWALHGIAYATLTTTIAYGLSAGFRQLGSWKRKLVIAVALALAYGLIDEWHQSFVPGRDPAVGDWIADGVGAVIAAGLMYWRPPSRGSSSTRNR